MALFNAAQKFNCQIFATTHSYECIQSAFNASLQTARHGEFTYLRLSSQNGSLKANTFDSEAIEVAIKSELEIR